MLSNHIQNENTEEKTEEKRPSKLMDGNRKRFVCLVVFSLSCNHGKTIRCSRVFCILILHVNSLVASRLAAIVAGLRPPYILQSASYIVFAATELLYFDVVFQFYIFSTVAAVLYFLFAVKAEYRNYSYLFAIIIHIWCTQTENILVGLNLIWFSSNSYFTYFTMIGMSGGGRAPAIVALP